MKQSASACSDVALAVPLRLNHPTPEAITGKMKSAPRESNIRALLRLGGRRAEEGRSRHPKLATVLDVGELADEGAQAGDVVGGDEQVNVRQHGLHPPGGRLVSGVAHQWVEPEDAAGVLLVIRSLIELITNPETAARDTHKFHPGHWFCPLLCGKCGDCEQKGCKRQ